MHMPPRVVPIVSALVVVLSALTAREAVAENATFTAHPYREGYFWDRNGDGILENMTSINEWVLPIRLVPPAEDRAFMKFDFRGVRLSGDAFNNNFVSATLSGSILSIEGTEPRDVRLSVYTTNGATILPNEYALNTNRIGTLSAAAPGDFSVTLDHNLLFQHLRGGTSYVGIIGTASTGGGVVLNSSYATGVARPTLTLVYVPEPAGALAALAVVAFAAARRHR